MDNPARLIFLFNKYIDGSCTPAELRELVDLLQDAEAANALDEPMEQLWQQLKQHPPPNSVNWESMYTAISGQPDEQPLSLSPSHKRYWYYAAAAVAVISTGLWIVNPFSRDLRRNKTALTEVRTDSLQHAHTRQTIHLPDGSTVTLNSNSQLDYPVQFTGNTREVYMTGEAYFDIAHNPQQPFIVHAGNLTTRVLGTTFNIKAYPADDKVLVTVLKGKVQVSKKEKTLGILTASQQITFTKSTDAVIQQPANTSEVIACKPGKIEFQDMTMDKVAELLEKRFNLTIEFANASIKNCKVKASFSEDDLPDEVLEVICGISNSSYTNHNNTITISGPGCN